ncbi:MAG: hypothetical protein AB8G22_12895 [Saprospiraceae bacterium]
MKLLLPKFSAVFIRLTDFLRWLPLRLLRLARHLQYSFSNPSIQHPNTLRNLPLQWLIELFVLFLDCFGITEIYETLSDFTKFNTRPLTNWEKQLAQQVFGNTINYERVRLDEYALAGPRQYQFCYVSFFTVNSWGKMNNALLLHELTHVWQYENLGATYIPRALRAQHSEMGYNYGGVEALKEARSNQQTIYHFNLEQQADIVMDYYHLREGYCAQWDATASFQDLPVYEYFVDQLKAG